MDSRVESLKARGTLEVVDAAADLLRRRTRDVALVAVVVVVPVFVFSLLVGLDSSGDPSFSGGTFDSFFTDQGDLNWSLFVAEALIGSLLFSFVTFAMCRLIVGEILGETVLPRTALLGAARRAPALISLWVLVHVAEALGIIALGVGLIVAMCGLMVTVPALASEPGLGPITAFKRSWRLSKGSRGRVFAVLLVLLLINMILGAVLVIAPVLLVDLVADGWALWVIGVGLQAISSVVVHGIVSAATVYTYIDLRVRREGLDIEMRMRADS